MFFVKHVEVNAFRWFPPEHGSHQPIEGVIPRKRGGGYYVETLKGKKDVNSGQWVLLWSDGNRVVWDQEDFIAFFKPLRTIDNEYFQAVHRIIP